MAKTPVVVTEDDYKADPENVQRVETSLPGFPDLPPVVTYFKVQHLDDLTGKPAEGIETVQILVPVEKERETHELDAEGDTVLNGDGSAKIKVEKYLDLERRELDLSPASLKKLQTALKPFTEKSREVVIQVPAQVAKKTTSGPNPALAEWNKRARTWLQNGAPASVLGGEEVPPKGRIKARWEEAYMAAHPQDLKPA
ncbi:hypothetical protein [Streptomyces sp. NPDC005385]|uniref:hypothetical protein n=1 Tax=Streptomyces sp. NPDC005385 TaxID=3157039 RepID=UPI0033BE08A9